jgi:hypothetical protein
MNPKETIFTIPATDLLRLFASHGVTEPRPGDRLRLTMQVRRIASDGATLAVAGCGQMIEAGMEQPPESHEDEGAQLRQAALWTDKHSGNAI